MSCRDKKALARAATPLTPPTFVPPPPVVRTMTSDPAFSDAYPGLFAYASRLALHLGFAPNDAEDLAQTVLVKLGLSWDHLVGPDHLRNWLIRALRTTAIDFRRRACNRRRRGWPTDADGRPMDVPGREIGPADRVAFDEDLAAVVAGLCVEGREVWRLFAEEGVSLKDIADSTGRPYGWVAGVVRAVRLALAVS